ncbi:MAG: SBBP repeat-containing protein [Byssovorax sp.]
MRKFGEVLGGGILAVAIGCAACVNAAGGGSTGTGTGGDGSSAAGSGGSAGVSSPTLRWTKRFGGVGNEQGEAVAIDGAGDVLVIGTFTGALDLGGTVHPSNGATSAFVARLDGATGSTLWSQQFSQEARDISGTGLALDASGNLFLTGKTFSPVDFGGGLRCIDGFEQNYLVKLDPQGHHLFSRCFGGLADGDVGFEAWVAASATGDVVLVGTLVGVADLGTGPVGFSNITTTYVARYDPTGNALWVRTVGGAQGDTVASGLTLDAADNVLVAGSSFGTFDSGTGPIQMAPNGSGFVVKLGPNGDALWTRILVDKDGGTGPRGLTVDGSGHVLTAGWPFTDLAFGSAPPEAHPGLVADFDPAGGLAWTQSFGNFPARGAAIVAADNGESIVLINTHAGIAETDAPIALAHLGTAGELVSLGYLGTGSGRALARRGEQVAITGRLGTALPSIPVPLTEFDEDVFVSVLAP